MQTPSLRIRAFAVAAMAMMAVSGWACADPPSRVARIGFMSGAVSFSPAGEDDWVQASGNRPLTTGDRIWADDGARAEIQVGGAVIRLSAGTGVSILNLDDRITQVQLTQGTLNVRVRRLAPNQMFEIDTPNLAFTLKQPGAYRIDVDPDGGTTTIVVRTGRGEAYGDGAAYVIDSRQPYRFAGTDLRESRRVSVPRPDEFDRWSSDRDAWYDRSISARYVSQDVIGYEDLDANGTWRTDANYGTVWIPARVAAGWAPYRDGHWAWIDPWGWTWVDDAPWGFAVSHYGRWANISGTWGWVPGPVASRAYYAPALVAFVGGSNFQLTVSGGNVGGVAWFPLAPREVYRPSYPASRGYFENVNRSNTVINTTVINNYYGNSNVNNIVYANRTVKGAVVAVPTTAFVQSQPVARAAVQVSREVVVDGPVTPVPALTPTERSVRGAAAQGGKPPTHIFERPIIARTAPPASPVGFAAQQQELATKPGVPLDDSARRGLRSASAVPAPPVKVIARPQETAPTARPPAPAASTPIQRATPAQPKAPVAAAQAPEEGGVTVSRGRAEAPRAQPVAPQDARRTPPVITTTAVPQAQMAHPLPQAPPVQSRGRPEPPRAQPVAPQDARGTPSVAPSAIPQTAPVPQAQSRGKEGKPASAAADDKNDKKKDVGDAPAGELNRKPRG